MPVNEHTHGNIRSGGTLQTTDVTIANGDKLVVTDSSDSSKIARTSLAFDGSTTSQALSKKGTWETFAKQDTQKTLITLYSRSSDGSNPVFKDADGNTITNADVVTLLEDDSKDVVIRYENCDYTIKLYADQVWYYQCLMGDDATIDCLELTEDNGSITNVRWDEKYYAWESHAHGNIQYGGNLQTNDISIANGDKLVVTDSSDSSKVARTSVTFDGSTTTKALSQKGTWESFGTYSKPSGGIPSTDLASAVQTSLGKADTALQSAPVTSVNGMTGAVTIDVPVNYSNQYLTIVSLADNNTIGWQAHDANFTKTVSISIDNGTTWTSKTSSTSGTTLATLSTGDKLLIKGTNDTYAYYDHSNYTYGESHFTSTGNYEVCGNIMSLIYGDNFIGATSFPNNSSYNFFDLFYDSTYLISAKNLILAATALIESCYSSMFYACSSLIEAPELPATTLAHWCYNDMFDSCTSLTTAPELPATTLAEGCYSYMFCDCTSLINAPKLPVTTLVEECYYGMFYGCTSLTTAPELPATTLADSCYIYMFTGCASLVNAPELPAATLVFECYYGMFMGCTSLNYIKCLATDISANSCLTNWVQDVAATGTFVESDNMSSWTTGMSGVPSGWVLLYEDDYELVHKYEIPTTYAGSSSVAGPANKAVSIPFAEVDSTSTSTVFTATVDGITALTDGVCVYLRNNKVNSASGCTLNVNGLGAKPIY